MLNMRMRNSGPPSTADSSDTSIVRRSRAASTISLRATAPMRRRPGVIALRSCRQSLAGPEQRDERVLERRRARLCLQLGGGAVRDDAPMREDDDAVAQRHDLLHDVRGEQQALALVAQRAQLV